MNNFGCQRGKQEDIKNETCKKLTAAIEGAAFDPWNALVEHRALGEVMRSRKVVYFQSQTGREG